MFADLDQTIRQILMRDVPLDPTEVDVSFEAPDKEWSGRLSRPTVNFFLYDVRENLELREAEWRVSRNTNGMATKKRPPMRIDATYLVTAWARAPEDEHRLLWRSMSALAKHPLLPDDMLWGDMVTQPYPVPTKVAHADPSRTNPTDLWQALENRIRPGVKFVATLALDPWVELTGPLVFTRTLRVGSLTGDGGDDPESTAIAGRVFDPGDPDTGFPGALVTVRETGDRVLAGPRGMFQIRKVTRDRITLHAEVPGREPVTQTFDVPSATYDLEV